jgi:Carboxypeptidase regulatory-like domain/TonB dependent receptor
MEGIIRWQIFLPVVAMLMLAPTVQAQTAQLTGIVTDSNSAVVNGVMVTAENLSTGLTKKAVTNEEGNYQILFLPPGPYRITVQMKGFRPLLREGVTLQVDQVARLDFELQVGEVTQTVSVTAEAPLLDSQTSSLGEVVNSRTAESLPLNGRNVLQLVGLTPGINTTPSYRNAATSNGSIPSNAFSANGGRNVSSEILVDGSSQIVMGYNQPAYVPNPDAVLEFKVQTNNLSAEYGRTGGAVINVVSRAGTREFHGVLFEFLRNDAFDAADFFANLNNQPKSTLRYNQFGGTLGGPLFTPRFGEGGPIINKDRDKTFFFFSYEGLRRTVGSNTFFTVPTSKMKQGDFSEISANIYDPMKTNAQGRRTAFPNNRIPEERIDPVAARIVRFYPEPNLLGVTNNYFSQAATRGTDNNYSIRVDRIISPRQNFFGRFSISNFHNLLANHYNNLASPNAGVDNSRNRSISLDDNYTVGGWVLHGNYGYAYHSNPRSSTTDNFNLTSLGFPGSIDNYAQFHVFPRIEPAGYGALGGDPTFIIGNKFETHTLTGDLSKAFGSHLIKTGGVYRINRVSNFRPNAPAGVYTFNEAFTREVFNGNVGGHPIASMLLGAMAGGRIQNEPALALQVLYGAVFVQDDWRVTNRLTLNLGLRWDSDRPLTERFDRTSWFDFDAVVPIDVPRLPPLRGGLVYAGRDGRPRGNKDPDNNNFAPRVGLAFKVTNALVVRSGFGVFFNSSTGIGPGSGSTGALGFNAVTPVVTSNNGGRTPATMLSNPFPNGFNFPNESPVDLRAQIGQGIGAQVRSDRTPYSMQWNLNLQYELPGQMLLDAAYAGNAGVKLLAQAELNQLPDEYLALGDALNQTIDNPFYGLLPANVALGAPTITEGQLLRPFPHLTGLTHTWGSLAHSSYHALQFKFRRRFSGGMQFLTAYTWSKTLDDFSSVAGFLNLQNPGYTNNNKRNLDKSLSAQDIPHRFVVNYQWELPFGKGKKLFNRDGVMNTLLGGWSLNGVTTIQSGVPISIGSVANTTNSYGGGQRPDATGISSITEGGAKERYPQWIDPAAFVNPPRYQFGTVGRFLPDNRGPHYFASDLSVLKEFRFSETKRLQFRAEFFNVFNQVNFRNPSGLTFGRPDFGRITDAEAARIIQFGLKLYY